MDEPTESGSARLDTGLTASLAISLAVSLPMWRGILPGNLYLFSPPLRPAGGQWADQVVVAALAGLGLALCFPVAAAPAVPAAAPAPAPMRAPFPPPASAPITAPNPAAPPIRPRLRLLCALLTRV